MLEVEQLQFSYPQGGFRLHIPRLKMAAGEALGLEGPSGAGKTTLLRLLAGILPPAQGRVTWQGASPDRRARRETMGLIFQDFALLDYLTAWENVLLPLQLAGAVTSAHLTRAGELLGLLEVQGLRNTPLARLSQGERQRVAVARALVHRPRLILADEPTSALDARRRQQVADLLFAEVRDHGAMLVLVTHDPDLQRLPARRQNVEAWTPSA